MPTTPNGLPYPLATDPVANGAADIQALAEAIDPKLADSGWQLITPNGAFVGGSPQVRSIGGVLYFRGTIGGTFASVATTQIGSMPGAFSVGAPPRNTTVATTGGNITFGQVAGTAISVKAPTAAAHTIDLAGLSGQVRL